MDTAYDYGERLLRPNVLAAILGTYIAQAVAYRLYQLFLYPYFVSPLRHLPGPTVSAKLEVRYYKLETHTDT